MDEALRQILCSTLMLREFFEQERPLPIDRIPERRKAGLCDQQSQNETWDTRQTIARAARLVGKHLLMEMIDSV